MPLAKQSEEQILIALRQTMDLRFCKEIKTPEVLPLLKNLILFQVN